MAKAKVKEATASFRPKSKVQRRGIHAKTKTSNQKASRNYKKPYRGQGK
jgi:hypothetical protein